MKTWYGIGWLGALTVMLSCGKGSGTNALEPLPAVSIADLSLNEGNTGTTAFEFAVTLSKSFSQAVSVSYSTIDGSAVKEEDYMAVSNQTLTFQPGETQKKIVVNVVGDDIKEGDETFSVKLSSPGNCTLARTTAVGTIRNEDTKVPFSNAGYEAPASYPGYTLSWSDEFNTNSLNTGNWSFQTGDGCPNLCGWGNNELEYYTERPDNLFFQDGKMIIEAKRESFGGKEYTSAKIVSVDKKAFQYGRIDIRAKLPKGGKGIWPALWMLPQENKYGGWPKSGEIDIMENIGDPNKVYGTLHFGPGPGSIQISKEYAASGKSFSDEFHVYSMEWKKDEIRLYVDNNLFSTVSKSDVSGNTYPFNETFYFIINMAVGGNWPGNPTQFTEFPQWLIVDYVRVYQ